MFKKFLVAISLTGFGFGTAAAVASQRTAPEPELDLALADQRVDAQLHRILFGLLEQQRREHPLTPTR